MIVLRLLVGPSPACNRARAAILPIAAVGLFALAVLLLRLWAVLH
jgi:hypothetical protein